MTGDSDYGAIRWSTKSKKSETIKLDNRVNLSKVAQDMGLSVSTVSRALSGSGRISEATRQKIARYLEEKNLVPNTRTKKYTDTETRIVAVTIPEEEEFFYIPYFQTIFFSIYDYFSIRGYQVIPIKTCAEDISNLEAAVKEHAMDGVILSRQVGNNREAEFLLENGVPFVLIGRIDSPDILQVETDIEGACRDLTNALLHKGCHKIAVMCAEYTHPINRIRLNGILDAYVQNYMNLDRQFVFRGTDSDFVAELAIEKILAAKMDCILCMDDNICLKTLLILRKMGIKVPEEIKVASLHNSTLLDKWHPSVTCVHFDMNQLGREAGRLLYVNLTEKQKLPKIKLGYEIQMKESTN